MAEDKKSAVVTVRSATTTALPPCQMGFADLMEPKAFGDDKAKFKLDSHFTPPGLEALKVIVDTKCIAPLLEKLIAEVLKNGGKKKEAITAEEWLENSLKEPKPTARIQLPFITIRAPGETQRGPAVMGCWDSQNNPLVLADLRMASGSWVQPIVYLNMFASKAANWLPTPSIKLVGVRVLRLVQFGGGGGPRLSEEADDAAIRAVMGGDYDASADLSAFMAGSATGAPPEVDAADLAKGAF